MTQAKIKAKRLNLRAKPSPSGTVLGELLKNTDVEVMAEHGDWLEVQTSGFVHRRFVEMKKTVPVKTEKSLGEKTQQKYLWQNPDLQIIQLEPKSKIKVVGTARQKKMIQTWNQYGGLLEVLGKTLGVDVGVALAVICVESSGVGFKDGRMIIRFEPHWFHKLWGRSHQKEFDRHFKFKSWHGETHFYRETTKAVWQSFHGNQAKEWLSFEIARGLDKLAAIKSISMGLGQVMGFNHAKIGYESPLAMFENFNLDVRYQIFGIFDFMSVTMRTALAKRQFVAFAHGYNGSGQAKSYGEMIGRYVGEWEKIFPV